MLATSLEIGSVPSTQPNNCQSFIWNKLGSKTYHHHLPTQQNIHPETHNQRFQLNFSTSLLVSTATPFLVFLVEKIVNKNRPFLRWCPQGTACDGAVVRRLSRRTNSGLDMKSSRFSTKTTPVPAFRWKKITAFNMDDTEKNTPKDELNGKSRGWVQNTFWRMVLAPQSPSGSLLSFNPN